MFWITILVLVLGALWLQGYRKIPADPPHKGIVTFFGAPTDKIVGAGWHWFFFYPWVRGVIPIDVTKKNLDLKFIVRTPDLVELEVPVSITYTPANLVEYLNAGKSKGVDNIVADIVGEKLRVWAIATDEGPQNAEEALKAGEEAVAILVKAIAGASLETIPSGIPTVILLKYFAQPQKPPTFSESQQWGKNWEKVSEHLASLDEAKRKEIQEAVERRREIIKLLRQGNGTQSLLGLGVTLNRLNIGEIKALGKFAEAAELAAKERREREAEEVEIQHILSVINRVKKELGVSNEQALEIIQTERGKVKKEIAERKWNISPETREMIEKITPKVLGNLLKGGENE